MKYRTEHTTEPHTVDGVTHQVTRSRTVQVPTAPVDWDRAGTRASVAIALLATVVSVAWSTYSIGELLRGGIGYGAASLFDAAWLSVLILEWRARFNRPVLRIVRRAGWAFLLIAMGAILWNGLDSRDVGLAVAGATVSALAKGLWWLTLKVGEKHLDDADAQWVHAELSRAHAQLAVARARREVARTEAAARRELLALEAETPAPAPVVERADKPADIAPGTVRSAVAAMRATYPDATVEETVQHLADIGVRVDADTVRALSADSPDTGNGSFPDEEEPKADRIADTVRTALANGVRDPDSVLAAVRAIHGADIKSATVSRTLRRLA
jgi:hypothetical protein